MLTCYVKKTMTVIRSFRNVAGYSETCSHLLTQDTFPWAFSSRSKIFIVSGGCLLTTLCAVPFVSPSAPGRELRKLEDVDSSGLSHHSLLRNASAAVVTSAIALVSQSLTSLNELSSQYVKEVYNLVKLYDDHNAIAGKQLGKMEDDLWQEIIQTRVNLTERKRQIQEVEAVLTSSLLVLQSAGEAAFNAGVENSAIEAKSKQQQTTEYLSMIQNDMRKAETALTKIQAKNILEMTDDEETR